MDRAFCCLWQGGRKVLAMHIVLAKKVAFSWVDVIL